MAEKITPEQLDARDAEMRARAAMVRAAGKPIGNGNPEMAAAELTRKSAANFSLIERINEMANRDADDWRYLTETLRKFVAQRRADLDYLDRLLLGRDK